MLKLRQVGNFDVATSFGGRIQEKGKLCWCSFVITDIFESICLDNGKVWSRKLQTTETQGWEEEVCAEGDGE